MAGTMMHLVIADRLLEYLNIENPALFYCGNLAPDAIMARENYERSMKRHTHFKDGTSLHQFRYPEHQAAYMERLLRFYETLVVPESPSQEVYLGYITHMLVDELYILHFRDRFVDMLVSQGKHENDKEFFDMFVDDVDQVDWELVRTYPFRHKMPDILRAESSYEIPEFITNAELLDSKDWVINKFFVEKHDKEPLQVMTMEANLQFIELCVEKIPQILRERFHDLHVK